MRQGSRGARGSDRFQSGGTIMLLPLSLLTSTRKRTRSTSEHQCTMKISTVVGCAPGRMDIPSAVNILGSSSGSWSAPSPCCTVPEQSRRTRELGDGICFVLQ
ncbi:uncharacterized protein LOC124669346 isoform X2 [Lolium rigidum]|uniref:uncharacterized protein LOC124669346 isoform X2 n=1 Tax=Lolium rigidum TaxID=89674 RepID=UPI001F5D2B9F|nr:uncharacterized protein LOC124669346 isoform X2 [Lolium rigidum]